MVNLDSLEEIKNFDKSGVYDSVNSLADQFDQAWKEMTEIELSGNFKNTKNIVVAGMGGSALGGRLVKYLYADSLKVPINVNTQYHLPHYVNEDTLVISSSYSGNTEEAVSCLEEAINKNAQVFIITSGGKLADIKKEKNLQGYVFDPKANPSGQPRMANGYSVAAIVALLNKTGHITVSQDEADAVVSGLKKITSKFAVESTQDNDAKELSKKIHNKIPILIASEHLFGAIHTFKNQINETAKAMSAKFDIPELNHHLMEGLKYPAESKKSLHFIFFESDLYFDRVLKRYPITQEVIRKNDIEYEIYKLKASTKLEQALEVLVFGGFVQLYLAILYGHDPAPVPMVDFFKTQLAKS